MYVYEPMLITRLVGAALNGSSPPPQRPSFGYLVIDIYLVKANGSKPPFMSALELRI